MSNIVLTELNTATRLPAPAVVPETARIAQESHGMPSPTAQLRIEVTTRAQQAVVARRRRIRVNWELIGVILLMLACTAVCLYRLIWMGQP